MSTHGVLVKIQDYPTWWLVDGVWKTFKYAELFSLHNCAKQNGLTKSTIIVTIQSVWKKFGFNFLLSVTEVNEGQAQVHAKTETAMPTLEIHKKTGDEDDGE